MSDTTKRKKTNMIHIGIGILTVLLVVFIVILMQLVSNIQGTARVVNYAGLIRGETQRIIKLENSGQREDELIKEVQSFIEGLRHGNDKLKLVRLKDDDFQDKMKELDEYFISLHKEIYRVRTVGYEHTDIISKSERFFKICDEATGLAEVYAQRKATSLATLEKFITADIVVLMLLIGYEFIKAASSAGRVTGIATGFTDLDYKLSGLHPSELIIVAARPAMGKTAFVLNIAQKAAVRDHVPTAIFSLEMSKEQLVTRMMAMEAMVDSQSIRTGDLQETDWEKIMESAGTIGRSPLIIDDTPGITIAELRSKCRRYKQIHGLDLIIIDYLQLMSGGKRSESRQQEISEISRSLKALAREMNAPVIALSQLSRRVEERKPAKPMLSDLRESGSIEQDADVVMFIYRDEYYNEDSEKKGIAEIIVDKQRNGSTGSVELVWLGQYTKFGNKERAPH